MPDKPEALQWHVGDWGSRLLVKARTGTLEVKARNRDGQEQDCSSCAGVRETIEHFLVECDRYDEERDRLVGSVTEVLGVEEWHRRIEEEEDGGILTVLGLYRGECQRAREDIVMRGSHQCPSPSFLSVFRCPLRFYDVIEKERMNWSPSQLAASACKQTRPVLLVQER